MGGEERWDAFARFVFDSLVLEDSGAPPSTVDRTPTRKQSHELTATNQMLPCDGTITQHKRARIIKIHASMKELEKNLDKRNETSIYVKTKNITATAVCASTEQSEFLCGPTVLGRDQAESHDVFTRGGVGGKNWDGRTDHVQRHDHSDAERTEQCTAVRQV